MRRCGRGRLDMDESEPLGEVVHADAIAGEVPEPFPPVDEVLEFVISRIKLECDSPPAVFGLVEVDGLSVPGSKTGDELDTVRARSVNLEANSAALVSINHHWILSSVARVWECRCCSRRAGDA